jgi:hypothetical protein
MADRTAALTVAELERVNHASATGQDRVNLALSKAAVLAGDGQKERRLAERECAWCFYLRSKLAGQAFTRWQCMLCEDEHQHSNTAVPRLCSTCSDTFGLCVSCGGDLDMRFRTKRFGRKAKKRKAVKSA